MKLKHYLPIVACALIVLSCKDDLPKQLHEPVTNYVQSLIAPGDKIDTMIIFNVDTATERTKQQYRYAKYVESWERLVPLLEAKAARNKLQTDICNSFPNDLNARKNLEDGIVERKKWFEEEVQPIISQMSEADSLSKIADSTSFLAYIAHVMVKYTQSNSVQKTDSIEVLVNKDLKVIEDKDFIK